MSTNHRTKSIKGNAQVKSGDNHSAVAVEKHEHHSGPIPPADEISKYELTLSGSANRIICMAEKQQNHVFEMQKSQLIENSKTNDNIFELNKIKLRHDSSYDFWRLISSIFICCLVILSGIYAIFKGDSSAGATIISLPLAGIIVAYISGKFIMRKNKEQTD